MGAFDRFFVDSARFVGFPAFCMVNHRGLGVYEGPYILDIELMVEIS